MNHDSNPIGLQQSMDNRSLSPSNAYSQVDDDDKLAFQEQDTDEEFKQKICLPYFKDIYKDLVERSDNPAKGINKISLLDYA